MALVDVKEDPILAELKKISKKLKDIEELIDLKLVTSPDPITGQPKIRTTLD